jgi:hypothetical protein
VKTNPAAPSAPFFCIFMALFQCVSPPLQLCSACATHLVFLGVLFQGFIRFLGTALCVNAWFKAQTPKGIQVLAETGHSE